MSEILDKARQYSTGLAARRAIRSGAWRGPTAGLAPGYVQANLVILSQDNAFEFLRFCVRNPKPCPVLDVTDPGSPHPGSYWARDADLRTDVPRYRVYKYGKVVDEPADITHLWQRVMVAFMLGCSYTFERAMVSAGLPVRHLECGCTVPVFRTNVDCEPAGVFRGPLVVTMRPIPSHLVARAVQITSRYPGAHGAPVHIGDPAGLGIQDIAQPDWGDPVPVHPNEVPVFWACGVTPQAVAQAIRFPLMITHAPGHMFIMDRLDADLAIA